MEKLIKLVSDLEDKLSEIKIQVELIKKEFNQEKVINQPKRRTTEIKLEIEKNKDGIAIIKTSKGEEILVDDDKYFDLNRYTWGINSHGYVYSSSGTCIFLMHRYLFEGCTNHIDHINNIKTDNRLSNLRVSDPSSNNHNKTKQSNKTSKYIGVCFDKKMNKFRAKNYVKYNLGFFTTEDEAAADTPFICVNCCNCCCAAAVINASSR